MVAIIFSPAVIMAISGIIATLFYNNVISNFSNTLKNKRIMIW